VALIEVHKVSKIYNPGRADEMVALDGVSLCIEAGDVTVLTGPSGSGKSSLLSVMGCMARPTEGRVVVDGKDVVKLPERFLTDIRRQRFGFVFQQFHLIRELTVLENVLLPLYPLQIPVSAMKQRGREILVKLRLEAKISRKIKKLSGGEQQRVAIARALVNDPQIIIADEPTAHLDSALAREFMNILELLNGEGKTIIIASHDPFISTHPIINSSISMVDGRVQRMDRL